MANKFFNIKNGLTVGNFSVDATDGSVTTSGNITLTGSAVLTTTAGANITVGNVVADGRFAFIGMVAKDPWNALLVWVWRAPVYTA